MNNRILIALVISLMCYSEIISSAQAPTTPETCKIVARVESPNGQEFILDCFGNQLRAITPDHIRAIELTEVKFNADEKVIALQNDQIANLQKAIEAAKKIEALDLRLDNIQGAMIDIKNDEVKHYQAYSSSLESERANKEKKLFVDKWPVRLSFSLLGAAANTRTAFFQPSPCKP